MSLWAGSSVRAGTRSPADPSTSGHVSGVQLTDSSRWTRQLRPHTHTHTHTHSAEGQSKSTFTLQTEYFYSSTLLRLSAAGEQISELMKLQVTSHLSGRTGVMMMTKVCEQTRWVVLLITLWIDQSIFRFIIVPAVLHFLYFDLDQVLPGPVRSSLVSAADWVWSWLSAAAAPCRRLCSLQPQHHITAHLHRCSWLCCHGDDQLSPGENRMRKKTQHDDKKKKFLSSGGESVLKGSSSEELNGEQEWSRLSINPQINYSFSPVW